MKKIIQKLLPSLLSLLAFGEITQLSASADKEDRSSIIQIKEPKALEKKSIHTVAQGLLTNSIPQGEFNILPPTIKEKVAKEYYYLADRKADQLPSFIKDFFQGVSIQDELDHNAINTKTVEAIPILDLDQDNQIRLSLENINDISGMQNIPGIENVTHLILSNNKFTYIPKDAFSNLQNLKYLELHDVPITTIEEGAFNRLTNLDVLNLDKNLLKNNIISLENLKKELPHLPIAKEYDKNLLLTATPEQDIQEELAAIFERVGEFEQHFEQLDEQAQQELMDRLSREIEEEI